MNYKHSQFNAGWWACFSSIAEVDLILTTGMAAMLKEVLREAGVSKEEIEYVLDHNIIDSPVLRSVVREYAKILTRANHEEDNV